MGLWENTVQDGTGTLRLESYSPQLNESELSVPDGILVHVVLRMSAGRMVGRDGELGRLLTLLDDAEAGRSVVALIRRVLPLSLIHI